MLEKYAFERLHVIIVSVFVGLADCVGKDLSRRRREDTVDVWKPADPLPEYTQHANYHLLPQQPECGVPKLFDQPASETVGARIRGGHDARLGQYPWIVLIETLFSDNLTQWRCVGSIINSKYILTARHCFVPRRNGDEWSSINVYVGDWDTSTDPDVQGEIHAPSTCREQVEEVIPHENFNDGRPTFFWYDVAMLRLQNELRFSDFVKPICLPFNHKKTQYQYAGDRMTQAGWGQYVNSTVFPNILQKLSTKISVWERCRESWELKGSYLEPNHESQVCVDVKDNEMTCKGDSGAPLMYAQVRREQPLETIFYLMGVHSFGRSCFGDDTQPPYKVSTWAPSILLWILNHVKE